MLSRISKYFFIIICFWFVPPKESLCAKASFWPAHTTDLVYLKSDKDPLLLLKHVAETWISEINILEHVEHFKGLPEKPIGLWETECAKLSFLKLYVQNKKPLKEVAFEIAQIYASMADSQRALFWSLLNLHSSGAHLQETIADLGGILDAYPLPGVSSKENKQYVKKVMKRAASLGSSAAEAFISDR